MKSAAVFGAMFLLTGIAATAAPVKPAPAIVTATDPNSVMQGLTAAGFVPKLTADSTGDPSITFTNGNAGEYRVWFQNCENHLNCKVIQLYCEWGPALVTPQKLNDEWTSAFNSSVVMYVNQKSGHLAATSYILTEPGGISRDIFVSLAKKWMADAQIAGQRFATPSK